MDTNKDNIKDSKFYGERIGDMDNENLFKVIEHLSKIYEDERESHGKTLRMWRDCHRVRRLAGR